MLTPSGLALFMGPPAVLGLWAVTSFAASMRIIYDNTLDAIRHLEQETGRQWYGRPFPDHR